MKKLEKRREKGDIFPSNRYDFYEPCTRTKFFLYILSFMGIVKFKSPLRTMYTLKKFEFMLRGKVENDRCKRKI